MSFLRMTLPAVCPAVVVPYKFRIWRHDFTHLVFLATAILPALFLTGIQSFWPGLKSTKFLIVVGLCAVGLFYLIAKGRSRVLVRTGAVAFYFYACTPVMISLLGLINSSQIWVIGFNVLANLLVFALTLLLAPTLRAKIRLTFSHFDSRHQLYYLPFVLILGFMLIALFAVLQRQINPGQSDNEMILDRVLTSGRLGDVMLLMFLILVAAPLTEELVARHALVQLTGQRSLGFFTSVVWFSVIHISATADWINIIGYLGGALALTGVFFLFNYNVVFSIIAHSVFNLVAVISTFQT